MMRVVTSLLVLPALAHGHALWQQVVQSKSGDNTLVSMFTFSEKPGVNNADGTEQLAATANDAGVFSYVQGADDDFYAITQVYPQQVGRYLAAELPGAEARGGSYVLEGVCYFGLYGHGDTPARNIVFYTSAPEYGYRSSPAQTLQRSRNRLRVDLVDTRRTTPEGFEQDVDVTCDEKVCVTARVLYHGRPLSNATVTLYEGNTGEEIVVDGGGKADAKEPPAQTTDQRGLIHFAFTIENGPLLFFAKVSHEEATPGSLTRDGQSYDATLHVATTVLELTLPPHKHAPYPADAPNVRDLGLGATLVAELQRYPGTATTAPQGRVYLSFYENGDVRVRIDAENLPVNCSSTTNHKKNGCGVHVHEGTSCQENNLVKGHYYYQSVPPANNDNNNHKNNKNNNQKENAFPDPWTDVRYDSDDQGRSSSQSYPVFTKEETKYYYSASDHVGRAMILHDTKGGRIACGILDYLKEEEEEVMKDMMEEVFEIVEEERKEIHESTENDEYEQTTSANSGMLLSDSMTLFITVLVASLLGGFVSAILVGRFGRHTYGKAPTEEVVLGGDTNQIV